MRLTEIGANESRRGRREGVGVGKTKRFWVFYYFYF